ncbi:LysR family transcriptional regulator [Marinicellulosiphila megalodicopiae]|uniref:LysR family transcriptional regulator n=1 Tax=Marinicellulosiphila megalodicopiae TaxID=2724896 RepID=UPI003BB1B9A7
MKLDDIELFVVTAQAQSLTIASQKLKIPKSTLSRRLAQLEKELGVVLLNRTTRKVLLTADGSELLRRSKGLIYQLAVLQDDFANKGSLVSGTLSLQIPMDFFDHRLMEVMNEFMLQNSKIKLQVKQYSGNYPTTLDGFDLTFVHHSGALPDSNFIARGLMSVSQSVYGASRRYRFNNDLDLTTCLTLYNEPHWYFGHGPNSRKVAVGGNVQLPSHAMLLEACLMGMGPAKLVDNQVESYVRSGALIKLKTMQPLEALTYSILYQGQYLPKRAEAFIEHFQSEIGRLSSFLPI